MREEHGSLVLKMYKNPPSTSCFLDGMGIYSLEVFVVNIHYIY